MIYPDNSHRRPRTGLIIAVTTVVCLLIGGAAVFLFTQDSTPETAPTPPVVTASVTTSTSSADPASSAPESSFGGEPPAVPAADGCLGGSDPFTALPAAQAAAPLDDQGAAAFALAFARWSVTFPIDPNASEVLPGIAQSGQAGASFTNITVKALNENARQLRGKGYTQAVTAYDKGEYRIVSGYDDGSQEGAYRSVQLTLYRELTKADGTTEEIKMTTTVMLEIEDQVWKILGSPVEGQIDPADPTFTWLPYTGFCRG